jgi:intracellular multiplication protein IcmD
MKYKKKYIRVYKDLFITLASCMALIFLVSQEAFASPTFGTMAAKMTGSFANIGLMITGGSYIAGLAFSIGAIMKFKQHKDNPTQVPIGTPISLVFIAAALLFLPTLLGSVGTTMFGISPNTAGAGGTTIS